eukprot:357881-Chlamydomonas_euryale.AAC.20
MHARKCPDEKVERHLRACMSEAEEPADISRLCMRARNKVAHGNMCARVHACALACMIACMRA